MVHPVQQANEGGNSGATMPRLSSASMRSTSSISSNEYPIQASTLGRPSLVQNQPQMYRQSSATPPSSLGSRQSTPPSQYGVMTRPSARYFFLNSKPRDCTLSVLIDFCPVYSEFLTWSFAY